MQKSPVSTVLFVLGLMALVSCVGCDSSPPAQADDEPTQQQADVDDEAEPTEPAAAMELDEQTRRQALTDPGAVDDRAPDNYRVQFQTTQGPFTVEVHRQWSPHGADRLFNLVRIGYFEDIAFFRVIDGFMAQFGIHDDPQVNQAWRRATIPDDEVRHTNERGTLTFATSGPDARSTQLFVNLNDNSRLDHMGFSPVAEVIEGMDVVDALYDGYGESAPEGSGPTQQRLQQEGNDYLRDQFQRLDYITEASIVESAQN